MFTDKGFHNWQGQAWNREHQIELQGREVSESSKEEEAGCWEVDS